MGESAGAACGLTQSSRPRDEVPHPPHPRHCRPRRLRQENDQPVGEHEEADGEHEEGYRYMQQPGRPGAVPASLQVFIQIRQHHHQRGEQDGVGAVRLDGEDDVVPAGAGTEVREQWSSSQHEAVLLRLQTDSSSNKWMEKMQMRFRMKQMMEEMMEESAPARPYRQNDNDNFDNKEMMEFFRSMFANKMDNSRDSYTGNSYTRDKQQTYKKDDTIARMSQLMDMFARSRSK